MAFSKRVPKAPFPFTAVNMLGIISKSGRPPLRVSGERAKPLVLSWHRIGSGFSSEVRSLSNAQGLIDADQIQISFECGN
jgi:hypothetical protein